MAHLGTLLGQPWCLFWPSGSLFLRRRLPVVRSVGLEYVSQRSEEALIFVRGANGNPQAPVQVLPACRVAHQNRSVDQGLPHLVAGAGRPEQHEVRP